MDLEVFQQADRLLAALVNGVYQGVILTGVVYLFLKFVPWTNAATRHAVWVVTLVVVAALPLIHFLLPEGLPRRKVIAEQRDTVVNHALMTMKERNASEIDPVVLTERIEFTLCTSAIPSNAWSQPYPKPDWTLALVPSRQQDPPSKPQTTPKRTPVPQGIAVEIRDIPEPAIIVRDVDPPRESAAPISATPSAALQDRSLPFGRVSLSLPRYTSLTILGALALLAVIRLVGLARQLWLLRELHGSCVPASANAREAFQAIALSSGAGQRRPELWESPAMHSPMVVGFCRPTVLVPAVMVRTLSPARLDPILRHELAHVQRFDHWANLMQQLLRSLFSFHPGVLWICRRLSIEREIACDDHVLAAGESPRSYAMILAEIASRSQCRDWTAAPAAWSRRSQLTERVHMILKRNRSTSPRLARARLGLFSTTATASALILLQMAPRLSLAQIATPAPPAPAAPVTAPARISSDAAPAAVPSAGAVIYGAATPVAPVAPVAPAIVATTPGQPVSGVAVSGERFKDKELRGPAQLSNPDQPTQPPQPVAAPRKRSEGSLEERLERVEQLLNSLLDQRPMPVPAPMMKPGAQGMPKPGKGPDGVHFGLPPHAENIPGHPGWKGPDEISKEAWALSRKEAARAEANARQIARVEKERAMKQLDQACNSLETAKEPLERQRKALEAQRDALEKQMESLEQQMEKLEEQHEKQMEKLEEQREKLEEQREREREKIEQQREKLEEQREHQEHMEKELQSSVDTENETDVEVDENEDEHPDVL